MDGDMLHLARWQLFVPLESYGFRSLRYRLGSCRGGLAGSMWETIMSC